MLEKKNDALIAAKAVLARYGGICGMTLHRWVRDPDLNFPKRLLINGRRYWRLSELLAWASAAQMPSILIHAGEITMHPMDVEAMPVASLRPYVRNARTHSRKQIRQIANSIERFLDPFGGSGTTLIAAEKTGRQSRLIEFDRAYCDRILRRFERVTGKQPTLAATGVSFEAVAEQRTVPTPPAAAQGEGLMNKNAKEPGSAYGVGYRKPPVHTRFRKGQSGNPSGQRRFTETERAKQLVRITNEA